MGSRNRFKYSKNKHRNSSGQVIKTVPSTGKPNGRWAAKKRIQQSQQQAIEDAARQTAQTQAYEPYQRLGTYGTGVAQLISGYPGQTQIAQTPQASPLQTALGLGAGIAGIYGGLTGKNPFAPIAKTLGF